MRPAAVSRVLALAALAASLGFIVGILTAPNAEMVEGHPMVWGATR